jgi:hypothetical protein
MEAWPLIGPPRRPVARISATVAVIAFLCCAVSTSFWWVVFTETEQTLARQVDYEDAALCTKFGFSVSTAAHDACKIDLLDLRHRHMDLIRQASFP